MKSLYMILAMTVLLVGIAFFVPNNMLTGKVVQSDTCGKLGCLQMCDVNSAGIDTTTNTDSVCGKGTVCCMTHWSSGVCDYETNCEKIREYSLFQTLETYQDSIRESPTPIEPSFSRFFLPLIIIITCICIVIFKYHNPKNDLK